MNIGDRVSDETFLISINDLFLAGHASDYAETIASTQGQLLERSDEHDSKVWIHDIVITLGQLSFFIAKLQENFKLFLDINKIDTSGIDCLGRHRHVPRF